MAEIALRKIALIGAMGSGKTTLMKLYSERYGVAALYTDEMFTSRYGDISAYFDAFGECEFRKREHEIVIDAVNSDARIISCGGGVVLDKSNMCALRQRCDIVLLTARSEVRAARIANSARPLKCEADRISKERKDLYECFADYVIDTSDRADCSQLLCETVMLSRKNRYDVLLCDADDTVLDFKTAMRHSVLTAARSVGVTLSDENIVSSYSRTTDEIWGKLERGEITRDELNNMRFRLLRERLNENFDPDEMNEKYLTEMQKTRFVIDGAIDFLRRVRSRNIKVYIVTNSFARIASERLKALDGETDGYFISEQVGHDKPDVRFFESVHHAIGMPDKQRILVFGDSLTSDIAGGKAFGADTCLFDVCGKRGGIADYTVSDYSELESIL